MATEYTSIYDLFTMLIKDYNLVTLYKQSENDFNSYLQGWLLFAINEFDVCDQSLTDRNDETGVFTADLTLENQLILAEIMVKYWLMKEVQDVMQMNLHLQDKDFKTYAESQNLQAKSAFLRETIERLSQKLNEYSYKHHDWKSWFTGNFSGE